MATLWTMTAVAGLWCFLICTIVMILKGFPSRGVFDRACALKWGIGMLLSFVVWIVGMTRA